MIQKIISGGQTGADRAALDFAIAHHIPHAGWCPKGRLAEDGAIDARYSLQETTISESEQRTGKNVQDSDGTVIFTISAHLDGGSKTTAEFAHKHGKPWTHLHQADGGDVSGQLLRFVDQHHISILNVAGSRASKEPGVYDFVWSTLSEAFGQPHQ